MFVVKETLNAKTAYELSKKAKEQKQQKEINDIFSGIEEAAHKGHIEYGVAIIHNDTKTIVDLMGKLGYNVHTYYENTIVIGWNLNGNNQS
jgi:hypothetical protein